MQESMERETRKVSAGFRRWCLTCTPICHPSLLLPVGGSLWTVRQIEAREGAASSEAEKQNGLCRVGEPALALVSCNGAVGCDSSDHVQGIPQCSSCSTWRCTVSTTALAAPRLQREEDSRYRRSER